MATHPSVLVWRIPGTGEPGGLPSMGLHRVRHDWRDLAAAAAEIVYHFNNGYCMSLGKLQETGKPGMLQSMGSQRVGHPGLNNNIPCECVWAEYQFSSVQLLSHVRLFATPRTATHQASLSITNSRSLLKLMSIKLVMPSNHLMSPSPPAFNLSQHQGLFQWVSSSHQVTKVLEFQLQHQSFQWIFRTDLL